MHQNIFGSARWGAYSALHWPLAGLEEEGEGVTGRKGVALNGKEKRGKEERGREIEVLTPITLQSLRYLLCLCDYRSWRQNVRS